MQTTTTAAPSMGRLSPALRDRINRLSGCKGHWVLIKYGEPESDVDGNWRQTPDRWLEYCLVDRWRSLSLGFVPTYLGYSSYSNTGLVGRANFNVFTDPASTPDPFNAVLTVGYGWDGLGVCLDVRYVTEEMLEAIEALESYPLISEDEHSQLELESQEEAWESWARDDFKKAVIKALQRFEPSVFPDEPNEYWAEELLDSIPDETLEPRLREAFERCRESANEYWVDEEGAYTDVDKVAKCLETDDLEFISGIPYDQLIPESQQWRRGAYPWPGAEAAPLIPSPESGE